MAVIDDGAQQYSAPDNDAALDVAIAFLRRIHPSGPWALATFGPDGKVGPAQTFDPSEAAACRGFLSAAQGKLNVHFSVNAVRGKPRKKAGKTDISEIRY